MACRRFAACSFQSFKPYTKISEYVDRVLRPSVVLNKRYYRDESHSLKSASVCRLHIPSYGTHRIDTFLPASSVKYWSTTPLISLGNLSNSRFYSSASSRKADVPGDTGPAASAGVEQDISNPPDLGRDLLDRVKDVWQSAVDAASYTGQKAKEVSDELSPHVDKLFDSHPYLKNVIVPVSMTLTATLLAWVVMPRLLRRFHKYSMRSPVSILSGSIPSVEIPYEKSFWGALEDPLRYLVTFFAFSQIGMMVAPTAVAQEFVSQACRGAVILSLVWFIYRWKTNVLSRALAIQTFAGLDRDRLLTIDKVSSVALFAIGLMALAEASGVAVQSMLTVGGIGGVATAFAARDILGNILSGLTMQFSQPFSLGDTIKAGAIEGQVVEMGLMSTLLLSAEKFPIVVPNSLFSSQVIINKSRAQWRAITKKIPLQVDDFSTVSRISDGIKNMLMSHPKVFLGKEVPYCFLSQIESTCAELTLGCNLKKMGKEDLFSTEQDILLQSVRIIKENGATLGSTMSDWTNK
ncbi:mechanosensitive ion channel protein 1, mitochondrial-like [Benincasa hispida]|uniref:mechanosensitive ion channel protein 1, mitochondrial-like n=1 Tax=Benincasa hispida TaxID=102211 RepID=UPI001900CA17|nr:mechanosensitive ion channel protein 1, mitochondrial-like [Benincasa hispida]XP_038876386.1 mechanosensitive ion channel protein 1, mitochondrial-like [Benincasa hispida]